MPTVAAGDLLEVQFRGTMFNQKLINTFHYTVATVSGDPLQHDFYVEVANKLGAVGNVMVRFLACCPAQYELNDMLIQVIKPVRLRGEAFAVATGGTSGLDASTANLAAVLTRRGDLARRRDIGSSHVPYPNKDAGVTAGNISDAIFANMLLYGTQVKAQQPLATVGTITPCLFHGPLKTDISIVTNTTVQTTLRVMRRRTVGVGK